MNTNPFEKRIDVGQNLTVENKYEQSSKRDNNRK